MPPKKSSKSANSRSESSTPRKTPARKRSGSETAALSGNPATILDYFKQPATPASKTREAREHSLSASATRTSRAASKKPAGELRATDPERVEIVSVTPATNGDVPEPIKLKRKSSVTLEEDGLMCIDDTPVAGASRPAILQRTSSSNSMQASSKKSKVPPKQPDAVGASAGTSTFDMDGFSMLWDEETMLNGGKAIESDDEQSETGSATATEDEAWDYESGDDFREEGIHVMSQDQQHAGLLRELQRQEVIVLDDSDDEQGPPPAVRSAPKPACPVCSQLFENASEEALQLHVNSCVDRASMRERSRSVSTVPARRSKSRSLEPRIVASRSKGKARPMTKLSDFRHQLRSTSKAPKHENDQPQMTNAQPAPSVSNGIARPGTGKPNAFTALMLGHAEDKAWKKAAIAEKMPWRKSAPRPCPFYKVMEGMPIAVDAFRYGGIKGIKAYFLSHAHADHYTNLSGSWNHGPVYASKTTCNLIVANLGVKPEYVHPLPFDTPTVIAGVTVTLIDANHCPGSCLFLFEAPHTDPKSPYSKTPSRIFRYLHCGDFRASPVHIRHPALAGKRIDICYLDTTYLNPRYTFPAQEQVVDACAALIKQRIDGDTTALRKGYQGGQQRAKQEVKFKDWLGVTGVKTEVKDEVKEEIKNESAADLLGGNAFDDEEEMEDSMRDPDEDSMFDREDSQAPQIDEEEDEEADTLVDSPSVNARADFISHSPGHETLPDLPTVKEELEPSTITSEVINSVRDHDEDSKVDDKQAMKTDPDVKPSKREHILVLVGTYSVGKEKIFKGIAQALGSKVYANEQKHKLFSCMDDPELHAMLTKDPFEAQVHVTNLFAIKRETLEEYLEQFSRYFTKIIGIRGTGWTFRPDATEEKMPSVARVVAKGSMPFTPAYLYPQRDSTERYQAYGVPYSEHSSFYELTCFALSLNYTRIIATVNVHNATSRAKMKQWTERWATEKKRRKEVGEPDVVPSRTDYYW
ncbi:uncharacterized protein L969DRAFT_102230 [Mixia osmundae IAM 14324]|uniref:Uncharacterized protein n=1 Tax=Mixia osmundae (strain CBS 9802 / IAM 14324 / JCM 22182 / KY 12970) TaxID=764103 RepID=G7E5H8_MIXOS|nr:uncharacterized protein L969DRAFT_102230 [Mixia osmundae IAM 14324]KEI40763.1 hypothetical protein L969DRAFT_102230 [Mixia osmundae IAM 14324]GAA98088.1 hypothetical protein E5Q_04770 [Mixia osmundae IAM 14324]